MTKKHAKVEISKKRYSALLFFVPFALLGLAILGLTSASTDSAVFESELGTTNSQLIKEDSSASGGQYVSFAHHQHTNPDSVPIPYIPPNDPNYPYDSSVIPEDDRIIVPLFGINKSRGQQLFTVDCKSSHFLYEDPIVYPGQLDRSHYHEFFGDRSLNAFSTLETIIGNADNTCEIGGDRSAYWTPAAYQDGVLVPSDNNKFYYKVGDLNQNLINRIQPMPLGLQMVAGDAKSPNAQSKRVAYYYSTPIAPQCQGSDSKIRNCKTTEPHTFETNERTTQLPTRPAGDNGLRALIRFPQCWDGKYLWLPGTAHMAYAESNGSCPSTHPEPLVQLQFNLGWTDAVGGDGFTLDSGEWYTLHGDFINGWRPETFERLVDVCTRAKRYCGLGVSEGTPCAAKGYVKNNSAGCIELRAGEDFPRFFGKQYN